MFLHSLSPYIISGSVRKYISRLHEICAFAIFLLVITQKVEGTTLRCTALSRRSHQVLLISTKLLKSWNKTRQAMYE